MISFRPSHARRLKTECFGSTYCNPRTEHFTLARRETSKNACESIGSEWAANTRTIIRVRLVFVEQHTSLTAPLARDAQLKRWSRAKKLALIAGDASRLRDLSRNRESRYSDPGAEK